MNLQRLKFAWARGARLQYLRAHGRTDWWDVWQPNWELKTPYRIYPDDEHLQYGPLSTALLEAVIYQEESALVGVARSAADRLFKFGGSNAELDALSSEDYFVHMATEDLLNVELLADEGL